MNLLQSIPSNPLEYGALALLIMSWLVAIRWLVKANDSYGQKLEEKDASFHEKLEQKKSEYQHIIEKKEAEIREVRDKLELSEKRKMEITERLIEINVEFISAIKYLKNGHKNN
ncbi:hypothetical protein [Pleomorphovibrio marinus]|uniref:hypothetical protein n=1 Tax=Pleomorphovibrio marinus TaxID=2164132 RepID=UPI000E0BC1B2|nr:hypothetical protein [Pleomorphovibrio marinus]